MTRLGADLLLLATAAVWGLAFVYQKTAMEHIGPLTFIAARSLLAAASLAPFAWVEARAAKSALKPAVPRIALLGGIAFFLGAALQQFGLLSSSVTNTGFVTALYAIFVPIIAWGWSRIAPSTIVWPAAVASILGTWLLGGGGVDALSSGDWLVAIGAVFWAVHVVITGQASPYDRPSLFTCLQFCVVAVIALAGAIVWETTTLAALRAAAPAILYVGLLSSALSFTILTIAMRHTPAAEASIIVSTESLFGAVAGAILLGDRLPPIAWAGAAMIVVATLVVQVAPHVRGVSGRAG